MTVISPETPANSYVADIRAAATRIHPYVKRTHTELSRAVSERLNTHVYVKYELFQKTGSFKPRGAFNKMLQLSPEEKKAGVVAVSGGNHAQAVAYAADVLGVDAVILMPENTSSGYLDATRHYGATIDLRPDIADAFAGLEEYQKQGRVLIHPFDDDAVIAGQGTLGLEIMEDVPQATDIIASIGGGGRPVTIPITSIAKTLGAPYVTDRTLNLIRDLYESVTVVPDSEAVDALLYIAQRLKVITEPAAACTLAAAERLRENFTPQSHVVLVFCGGNTSIQDACGYISGR
jgi:threonine dehydratase